MPPADPTNNVCAMINVRGLLTPKGSEAAMQKVVDRQEVFRLSFLPGKVQAMQLIRRTGQPTLVFQELSSSQQSPEAIEELSREIFTRPFDLMRGPLYRAEVFRRSADDHILVFAIHHSIADGWTLGVFVQDLFAAYLQGVRGSHGPLPPVPLSYTDWGVAERTFWQPTELETRASWWRKRLADRTRLWDAATGQETSKGCESARLVLMVPEPLGRALRDLARRHGATLFSTLLTAFQIAMSRWTGVNDIVVGTPVANRGKQAVRETMGYCSGIVPLRGQIDPAISFADQLRTTHSASVESFANAMPFAELVAALGEVVESGRNPIFEVRFALQNHPIPDVAVPGLSLQLRMRSSGTARFALGCEITEQGDALEVAWLYQRHRFAADDVERLSGIYLAVLSRACNSPEMLTSALISSHR